MADILSLFVSNEAAMRFIKKTAKVTYVLLIANGLLTLSDLADWYKYMDNIPHTAGHHNFYRYTMWPILYMFNIGVLLTGSLLNYRGFAQLKDVDTAGDDMLISSSFKYFYYAYILFFIASCTLLIDRGFRIFI